MSYSSTGLDKRLVPTRRSSVDAGSVGVLVAFLAISAAVAVFGSVTTVQTVDGWYADAAKVAWSPPGWVFGPV